MFLFNGFLYSNSAYYFKGFFFEILNICLIIQQNLYVFCSIFHTLLLLSKRTLIFKKLSTFQHKIMYFRGSCLMSTSKWWIKFRSICSPPFSIPLCAPRGRPKRTAPGFPSPLASGWIWSMKSSGRRLNGWRREKMGYLFPWLPYCLGTIDWMFVSPFPPNS